MPPEIIKFIGHWLRKYETELRAQRLALKLFKDLHPDLAQELDGFVSAAILDPALLEKMRLKFDEPLEKLRSRGPAPLEPAEVAEFLEDFARSSPIN